ncbi:histidine kinase [Jonesiaceae bacterium BS-20]|uniref:histidine kinase n=1 Tax=Jonesiaceae bacterium BS-20 TaxID=3120821 RepID=A0AAU7DWD0_9MICO
MRTPLPLYPPPPLTVWGQIWRYGVAIISGAFSFLLVVGVYQMEGLLNYSPGGPGMLPLVFIDLALAPVMFLAMALRRRKPLLAIVLVSAFAGFSSLGSGAITFTLVSVATRRRWKELIPAAVLWFFSTWAMQAVSTSIWAQGVSTISFEQVTLAEMTISSFTFFTIMVAIGLFIGGRRQAIGALEARVAAAEDIRDARFAQARANERSSIAREMHDVLAHRISLVALHSGALSYRKDLSAEQVAETAEIIRDNSHQALKELRTVLGVLRDPASGLDAPPDLPQPALTDLDVLIQDSRLTGTRIDLHAPKDLLASFDQLNQTISRNAYRVLQECLTNARKHAPNALVTLKLSGNQDDGLFIECRNGVRFAPLASKEVCLPSSGLGLVGMQERIRASGGTLEFGAPSQNFFEVKVWLPWQTR